MFSASDAGSFVDLDVGAGVWLFLSVLIAVLLLVDLLVVHRNSHVMSTRRALVESLVWISIGLAFSLFVLAEYGGGATGEYLSAYLIEKSLSIDNVFVWSVILTHYRVPEQYQHRVLFWGIFGALAMRLGFILAGVAVIERFEFTMVLFGAFLLWTGAKLFRGDDEFDPADSKPMKIFHRFVPSVDVLDGQKLVTRHLGRRVATPLLAVLVLIELTDLLFAVDSVPAVLAISDLAHQGGQRAVAQGLTVEPEGLVAGLHLAHQLGVGPLGLHQGHDRHLLTAGAAGHQPIGDQGLFAAEG